jgi:small subunit ribosomal protein S8
MAMTSTDPISDMLTRIRNAIMVRKTEVVLPHSKVKQNVAQLLADNGFIDSVDMIDEGFPKLLKLTVNQENTNARITEITRISKPGRRSYVGADAIPTVKRGRGMVIVSTSKGVMTGAEAKKQGVGGELICRVY